MLQTIEIYPARNVFPESVPRGYEGPQPRLESKWPYELFYRCYFAFARILLLAPRDALLCEVYVAQLVGPP